MKPPRSAVLRHHKAACAADGNFTSTMTENQLIGLIALTKATLAGTLNFFEGYDQLGLSAPQFEVLREKLSNIVQCRACHCVRDADDFHVDGRCPNCLAADGYIPLVATTSTVPCPSKAETDDLPR